MDVDFALENLFIAGFFMAEITKATNQQVSVSPRAFQAQPEPAVAKQKNLFGAKQEQTQRNGIQIEVIASDLYWY